MKLTPKPRLLEWDYGLVGFFLESGCTEFFGFVPAAAEARRQNEGRDAKPDELRLVRYHPEAQTW